MCERLKTIALLAAGLGDAELRLLVLIAASEPLSAGSRELSTRIGMSRRSVQVALDSLAARSLIHCEQGTATRAASYRLDGLFLGGATARPPGEILGGATVRPPSEGGGATVRPPSEGGGATVRPPAGQGNTDDTRARASDRSMIDDLIDRVLCATAADWGVDDLAHAARHVRSYYASQGRSSDDLDSVILAQLLTVCGGAAGVEDLARSCRESRLRPGDRNSWLLAVAFHRWHGVVWKTDVAPRLALRTKRPGRAAGLAPAADTVARIMGR